MKAVIEIAPRDSVFKAARKQLKAAEADADTAELDAVIVTGTRTTGLRAVDSPAPVTVLDSTALTRVGQTDLIQAIAQNVPSFNAQAFGGDTANLTLSAKLRGLSPNQRAWARFRRNRLGWWSMWLFAAMLLIFALMGHPPTLVLAWLLPLLALTAARSRAAPSGA